MKEIKDLFSLVGGPLKASTKSHILASTSDIYDEFWGTYLNVINEYNSNPLDAFLVKNKGIITEIIDSTKIQTLTKTTLNVGDLCLGIYKDDTLTNSKYDYSEGEYLIPGYKSVYFTITEISNDYIAVSVETDEIKPNTIFVVIGNTKNGINFSLNTEDLKADFINVKAFKIVEDNIKNISGKFTYKGVSCEGTLLDKIYTSNSIGYLSNAPSLNSAFKSNVFTRNPDRPSVPTGGRYDNPIPVDVDADGKLIWSDGIPDGNAILWASTRIFSSDGKYPLLEVWTEPKQMTDTASFNVEFSKSETPKAPTDFIDGETEEQWRAKNPDWENTSNEDTIWMATNTCKNGVWSDWKVSKIKGEKGEDGTSISILGSARKVDTLPTELGSDKALLFTNHLYEDKTHPWIYLWNKTKWEAYSGNAGESYLVDGNLYVWDGDSWENAGSFKGDKGESAYIHIKYARQDDNGEEVTLVDGSTIKLSFTDSNGEVPGLYLGLKPDNKSEDSKDITDYTWTKWKGEDGFGYEYIYCRTTNDVPPIIPAKEVYGWSDEDYQGNDFVPTDPTGKFKWTDNPQDVDEKNPYCWMCYRQKVDGVWQQYKGSSTNKGYASVWTHWAKDGKNAIILDLDNQLDSILYDGSGNNISGTVFTTPTLYNGSNNVTDDVELWSIESTEQNTELFYFDNTCGELSVYGITNDSALYTISAVYNGERHTTNFSVKKLVGVDKFRLITEPNAVSYNTTTGEYNTSKVFIKVYRTSQTGDELVKDLDEHEVRLIIDGGPVREYNEGFEHFVDFDNNGISIELVRGDGESILDAETVPITKTANGEQGDVGENAINIVLTPSSIILTQDPETNEIDFTNAVSQVKLYKGLEEIKTGFSIDEVIIDDGANENTVEAGPIGDDKIVIDGIIDNPTSGKIEVIVKYENNTYSSILQYAINWVGTWSATIKNDVYKAVASKTFSYLDENEKLVEVNGISTIEQSAEGIKSDVEQIKTTQTSQQQTISSIQLTSESLTTRISSVENRQDGQDQTISSIELNIDKISLQVDSYQESIDSHTKSISELNISKNGIETRVSTTETLLGKVSTTLSNHASAIEQTAEQINLKVGSDLLLKTGINITSGKITLSADNTIFNGNVQFNGLIVEATKNSYGSGFVPIDMVNTSSVTAKAGDLVLLPAQQTEYDDFELSIGGGDNNTNGYKPSQFFKAGAKLSITNPYDATVSAWRLIQNNETYKTYLGDPTDNFPQAAILAKYKTEYKNLLSKAVLVVSDPRLFNGYGKSIGLLQQDDTFGGTTIVASNQDTARWGGLFSCGGAIGRLVLVLPGQSLKLTSSIVTLGGREWLMWNVDNPEEFVPISKNVHLLHGWEEDGFENYEVVANNLWLNKYTPSMSVVASHSGTDENASMFGPKILCDTNSGTDYYEYIHIYLDKELGNNTSVYYPKFEIE